MKINLHLLFVLTLFVFLTKFFVSSAYTYHYWKEVKVERDIGLVSHMALMQEALMNADTVNQSSFKQTFSGFNEQLSGVKSNVILRWRLLEKKPATPVLFLTTSALTVSQMKALFQTLQTKGEVVFLGYFPRQGLYLEYEAKNPIELSGLVSSIWLSVGLIFLVLLWWWIFIYYEKKLPLRLFSALGSMTDGESEDAVVHNLKVKINEYYQEKHLMLSALSHDIKTPLTEAMLQLDLMEDPRLRAQVSGLRRNLEQIRSVVNSSLNYARDEKAVEKVTLEAADYFKTVIEDFSHKKKVAYSYPKTSILIEGEPTLLRRMLFNLMENGLHYGTQVWVDLSVKETWLSIQVSDNGSGVPKESLSKLASPYYRVDPSRSRSTGGSGLGLAIVRKIVFLHGGQIFFENGNQKERTGLNVNILLPLKRF